jgi:hypothetical protein
VRGNKIARLKLAVSLGLDAYEFKAYRELPELLPFNASIGKRITIKLLTATGVLFLAFR